MSDQWFYRVFGEEFGPMPLEKLKELADFGTIQPLDDVRSSSGSWMPAVNVEELGLSTSQRRTATAVVTPSSDFDVVTQTGNDAWYCAIGGTELGPVSFDEIIAFAESEQIGPDDQVKLGASGKWRRAGSIGRLVSVFPYQAVEKKIESKPANSIGAGRQAPAKRPAEGLPDSARQPEPPASESTADIAATYRVAYEQAAAKVAESMVAQADAAYKAAEQQAMSTIAWASQAGVDRYWWGWSNGLEFGPVEFPQVFGLAKSGQLKPSDFVRNGQNGQYVPASSLPGVFTAVASIVRAAEARDLAKSQAQAAAKQLTPPVTVPVTRINAEKAAAVVEQPAPAPVAASRPAPAPRTAPVPQPAPIQSAPLDPDESILGEIRSTLSSRNVSGLNQLEFNVDQGVVTILGTANSEGERLLVNHLVQKIPGVVRVVDSTTTAASRPVPQPRAVSAARPAASSRTSNGPGFVAGLISNLQEIKPAHAVSVAASIGLLGLGYWYFGTNPARPVAVHPVKGKIIMNGEPLANASIVLHRVGKSKLPINLHPRAKASEDGTFALETFDPADGAPNGEFIATVFLSTVEEVNGEKLAGPNVLPVVYSRPETSPLKIQITSSTTELKPLELTQK